MIAAAALLAVAGAAAQASGPGDGGRAWHERSPVERELEVRSWALAPLLHAGELEQRLASPIWRERAFVLDALARALAGGAVLPDTLAGPARLALRDPHPNVRARALALVAAGGGAGLSREAGLPAELARDEFPPVRAELARALEHSGCEGRSELLLELARDPDPRVARAARASLCGLEDAGPQRLALLERLVHAADRDLDAGSGPAAGSCSAELVDLTGLLARSRPDPRWLEGARASLDGELPLERDARALIEALAFAAGAGGDARALLDGWIGAGTWNPLRSTLLGSAARGRDEELGRQALALLQACSSGTGREHWNGFFADLERVAYGEDRELARRGCLSLALDSLGRERVLPALAELELAPGLAGEILVELGQRLDEWDGSWSRWTGTDVPGEVRLALATGVARSFARAGADSAAELLARLLEDPEARIRARAFEALARAARLPPGIDEALLSAWERLEGPERQTRLGSFSRERALVPFRETWLALGSEPGGRCAACELLSPFEGDPGVRAGLEAWLRQDLRRLDDEAQLSRELELRVQGALRALSRVDATASVGAFEEALRRSLGRSTEIGKVAAAALGCTEEGRARLAFCLGREIDRRTRIEAAIALATRGTPPEASAAVRVLCADRPHAAWDLRQRMLRALGSTRSEEAFSFLAGLALQAEVESQERVTALAALAEHSGARAVETLARAARDPGDIETRRCAVEELGKLAGGAGRAALAELFRELDGTCRNDDERAALRGELVLSLARAGDVPVGLESAWLAGPLAAARRDLEARLSGEDRPGTDFAWRAELALARSLGAEGRAERALTRAGEWWQIDGRALVALGDEVLAGGEEGSARALFAAGVVALLGEREPDARALERARMQLLALAWRAGRWGEAARLGALALAGRRAGELSDATWTEFFGARDTAREIDPDARVASLVWQARARAALERGELAEARAAAGAASRRIGGSRLARDEQHALEKELVRAARPGQDR